MSQSSGTIGYNVALRYGPEVEGYAGIITWSTFPTKEEFDAWHASQSEQEIVEEGISEDRCVELVRTTPVAARAAAAFFDSTDQTTGTLDPKMLGGELERLRFAYTHGVL
jgi:hypothetical protein